MAQAFVDLHTHSTASDGTLPPRELIRAAKDAGLSALALTDHDTVGGIAEAADEAKKLGIDFLPGIEISAEFPHPGTLHLLGYGIDPANPSLQNLTSLLIEGRNNRNPQIVEKLNELNVKVTMDEWQAKAQGGVLGRPQLAALLVEKGYASSVKDAFNRFLGQGAPAYFDKERLQPRAAIERIHQAGGLAVIAHATQLRRSSIRETATVIKNLADQGLDGIEVIHSDFNDLEIDFLTRTADDFDLLKTGGSDFHGGTKPKISLGSVNGRRVPREFYDELTAELKRMSSW